MSESKFVAVSTVLGDSSVVHDVEVHADDGETCTLRGALPNAVPRS